LHLLFTRVQKDAVNIVVLFNTAVARQSDFTVTVKFTELNCLNLLDCEYAVLFRTLIMLQAYILSCNFLNFI